MTYVNSFPPIARKNSKVLILGSMPGRRSLQQQQYYAHPQNRFWHLTGTLLGFDPGISYGRRVSALLKNDIALWDVLQSCYRPGSMDVDIRDNDLQVNDFATFLTDHRCVRAIYFNGAKAEQIWRRHVEGVINPTLLPPVRKRLPSTSPAYAAMSFEDKLKAWRCITDF